MLCMRTTTPTPHLRGGAPTRVEALTVEVTSKVMSAPEVVRRIDAFLQAFRSGRLASLDDATVREHASALATRLLEPPKRLGAEAAQVWPLIRDGRPLDVRERLAAALGRVRPSDVRELYDAIATTRVSSRLRDGPPAAGAAGGRGVGSTAGAHDRQGRRRYEPRACRAGRSRIRPRPKQGQGGRATCSSRAWSRRRSPLSSPCGCE